MAHQHEIVPVGIKRGEVFGQSILPIREQPKIEDIDTITMYIGPHHHEEHIAYLLGLNPKRIIFNPGTENAAFMSQAKERGIEVVEGCTLVMLSIDTY